MKTNPPWSEDGEDGNCHPCDDSSDDERCGEQKQPSLLLELHHGSWTLRVSETCLFAFFIAPAECDCHPGRVRSVRDTASACWSSVLAVVGLHVECHAKKS